MIFENGPASEKQCYIVWSTKEKIKKIRKNETKYLG